MPGKRNPELTAWSGWLRSSQVDWLRSQARVGIGQSDLIRDAIDLIAAVLGSDPERQADIESYIRIRYERIISGSSDNR